MDWVGVEAVVVVVLVEDVTGPVVAVDEAVASQCAVVVVVDCQNMTVVVVSVYDHMRIASLDDLSVLCCALIIAPIPMTN